MAVRTDYGDLIDLVRNDVEVPTRYSRGGLVAVAVATATPAELSVMAEMIERRYAILRIERNEQAVLDSLNAAAKKWEADRAGAEEEARFNKIIGMSDNELAS